MFKLFNSDEKWELNKTIRLSLPITFGLLGQALFGVTDTLIIGNFLGELAISAATIGISTSLLPFLFGIGLTIAVPILTAQATGRREKDKHATILFHGLVIALLVGIISAIGLILFIYFDGLLFLKQPQAVADEARVFTYIFSIGLIPALGFQVFKVFLDAIGRPWTSLMWLSIGLILNIFLNWVFISGQFGIPSLGVAGSAWGTLIARSVEFIGIYCCHKHLFPSFKSVKLKINDLLINLRLGFPAAMHIFFEGGLFIATPFIMGWFGEKSIAANQIAMNISHLAFMIPLGISQSLSIRVGEYFGAKNFQRIKLVSTGTLKTIVLFMLGYVCLLFTFRSNIAEMYHVQKDTEALAMIFLAISGFYALFDGIQGTIIGVLRGFSDVNYILFCSIISYWVVGFPLGITLAEYFKMEGTGMWIGLASGIGVACVLLSLRLAYKTKSFQKLCNTLP